jgi:hypothetical protein
MLASFVVLGPLVAKRSLGGPAGWAAVLTAEGFGWLAGGLTLLRVAPRRPLLVAIGASATAVLPMVLLAVPAPLAAIVCAGLFAGVATMLFNTLFETMLQQQVPERALSRVSSFDWFGVACVPADRPGLDGPARRRVGVRPRCT